MKRRKNSLSNRSSKRKKRNSPINVKKIASELEVDTLIFVEKLSNINSQSSLSLYWQIYLIPDRYRPKNSTNLMNIFTENLTRHPVVFDERCCDIIRIFYYSSTTYRNKTDPETINKFINFFANVILNTDHPVHIHAIKCMQFLMLHAVYSTISIDANLIKLLIQCVLVKIQVIFDIISNNSMEYDDGYVDTDVFNDELNIEYSKFFHENGYNKTDIMELSITELISSNITNPLAHIAHYLIFILTCSKFIKDSRDICQDIVDKSLQLLNLDKCHLIIQNIISEIFSIFVANNSNICIFSNSRFKFISNIIEQYVKGCKTFKHWVLLTKDQPIMQYICNNFKTFIPKIIQTTSSYSEYEFDLDPIIILYNLSKYKEFDSEIRKGSYVKEVSKQISYHIYEKQDGRVFKSNTVNNAIILENYLQLICDLLIREIYKYSNEELKSNFGYNQNYTFKNNFKIICEISNRGGIRKRIKFIDDLLDENLAKILIYIEYLCITDRVENASTIAVLDKLLNFIVTLSVYENSIQFLVLNIKGNVLQRSDGNNVLRSLFTIFHLQCFATFSMYLLKSEIILNLIRLIYHPYEQILFSLCKAKCTQENLTLTLSESSIILKEILMKPELFKLFKSMIKTIKRVDQLSLFTNICKIMIFMTIDDKYCIIVQYNFKKMWESLQSLILLSKSQHSSDEYYPIFELLKNVILFQTSTMPIYTKINANKYQTCFIDPKLSLKVPSLLPKNQFISSSSEWQDNFNTYSIQNYDKAKISDIHSNLQDFQTRCSDIHTSRRYIYELEYLNNYYSCIHNKKERSFDFPDAKYMNMKYMANGKILINEPPEFSILNKKLKRVITLYVGLPCVKFSSSPDSRTILASGYEIDKRKCSTEGFILTDNREICFLLKNCHQSTFTNAGTHIFTNTKEFTAKFYDIENRKTIFKFSNEGYKMERFMYPLIDRSEQILFHNNSLFCTRSSKRIHTFEAYSKVYGCFHNSDQQIICGEYLWDLRKLRLSEIIPHLKNTLLTPSSNGNVYCGYTSSSAFTTNIFDCDSNEEQRHSNNKFEYIRFYHMDTLVPTKTKYICNINNACCSAVSQDCSKMAITFPKDDCSKIVTFDFNDSVNSSIDTDSSFNLLRELNGLDVLNIEY